MKGSLLGHTHLQRRTHNSSGTGFTPGVPHWHRHRSQDQQTTQVENPGRPEGQVPDQRECEMFGKLHASMYRTLRCTVGYEMHVVTQ